MTTSDAAEHLRVIRQLMERSTVYRAISAPTAMLGGLCALGLSWWQSTHALNSASFHRSWLTLFAFLSAVNMFLLWRDARRRGAAFLSPGMKLAMGALAPPLLAGFVFGLNFIIDHSPSMCALSWAVFYGLALLATASFAPASIARLGRAFVLAALILLALSRLGAADWLDTSAITALTFGALHILYAAAVIISSRLGRT
ncbi:MAG: hypothetical protein ACR2OZ_00300 [Verrucomicrobiales bacterium]